MKKSILALVLCFLFQSAVTQAAPDPHYPHLINMVPQKTFIPPGFDSNDRAEVVISGYYPSTCYKQGPTSARVDEAQKKIIVTHQAYIYESCWCLQVIVPYQETVQLGILKPGAYQVVALDAEGAEHVAGSLPVAVAKSDNPDDFIYASVDQVYVDKTNPAVPMLTLTGNLPGDCATLQEVRLMYRVANLIEVLPIVQVKDGPDCHPTLEPFETKVQLSPTSTGSTLIYVRSLNGRSVSQIVTF